MLVIKEENYPIKVGVEVFNVEYPSFKDVQQIARDFKDKDGDEAVTLMKKWLVKLGLSKEFFDMKIIKAHHVMKIWGDLNSVKK